MMLEDVVCKNIIDILRIVILKLKIHRMVIAFIESDKGVKREYTFRSRDHYSSHSAGEENKSWNRGEAHRMLL